MSDRRPLSTAALCAAGALATSLAAAPAFADGVVNIYSSRQPNLVQPVLDAFTAATGIGTRVLFLDRGLEDRIAAEGANSPADIILTVDLARLAEAKDKGVTQALDDPAVDANIPAAYRDPEGNWFGLTQWGRVVYASKERTGDAPITYAGLADPKWKGRICIRSGQHDDNLGLFAAAIAHWGAEKTEAWMTALKGNLARKPAGTDRSQAKAILAGECDIALGNSYEVPLMARNEQDPQEQRAAAAIRVALPAFENGGTYVNLSGAALARYAPHRDEAVKLLEYLSSDAAQQAYAGEVFEYPVKPGLEPSGDIKAFGTFHADTLPRAEIAAHRIDASKMVDKVGLNDGPEN